MKQILLLQMDWEGVYDGHSQGLSDDFIWVVIDRDRDAKDNLELLSQIEPDITDEEFKEYVAELRDDLEREVKPAKKVK